MGRADDGAQDDKSSATARRSGQITRESVPDTAVEPERFPPGNAADTLTDHAVAALHDPSPVTGPVAHHSGGRHLGVLYSRHRTITRMTNVKLSTYLFGDGSDILRYLRGIGYDLGKVEQLGRTSGRPIVRETPFLVSMGTGTVIADGLSVVNAGFSATSFRVSQASIGGAISSATTSPTRPRGVLDTAAFSRPRSPF